MFSSRSLLRDVDAGRAHKDHGNPGLGDPLPVLAPRDFHVRHNDVVVKGRPHPIQYQVCVVECLGAGQVDAKDPVWLDGRRRCSGDVGSGHGVLDGADLGSVLRLAVRPAAAGPVTEIAAGHGPKRVDVGIAAAAAGRCLSVGGVIYRHPPNGSRVGQRWAVVGVVVVVVVVLVVVVPSMHSQNGTDRGRRMIQRGKSHWRAQDGHAIVVVVGTVTVSVSVSDGFSQDVPVGRKLVHGGAHEIGGSAAVVQGDVARIGRGCRFVFAGIGVGPATPRKIGGERGLDVCFVCVVIPGGSGKQWWATRW